MTHAAPDLPTTRSPREAASPFAERVALVTSRVTQAVAVWLLLGLVLLLVVPGVVHDVGRWVSVVGVPSQPSFYSVVLVGIVASGLLRRLRAALWFVVLAWLAPRLLLAALSALDVMAGDGSLDELGISRLDLVAGAVALVAIPVLVASRRAFTARLRPRAWLRAVSVVVVGIAVSTVVSTALLQLVTHSLEGPGARLRWSLANAVGFHAVGAPSDPSVPAWVGVVSSAFSAAGLLVGLAVFLRSASVDQGRRSSDVLTVRRLLLAYPTDDSLGYFATRDDRSVVFAASGEAGVSYRVVSGVSLAAGDPVGDPAHWPDAVARWLEHTRAHGWIPAVTSTSPAGARVYRDAGLHPLPMGDEAVIETRRFDLTNPAVRSVRRSVDRGRTAGYTVQVRRQSTVPPSELADLVTLADTWRHGDERGYSMALDRLGSPVDPREVVVTAHDADGTCQGLLSFVPWGRRGLSLDVMRRSQESISGVTEIMVAGLVESSRELGVERISMNFAMFRETFELGERIGATPLQRMNRRVLLLASRFWQLEQLYRSNEKYLPDWRPRLLCYEASSQLTRIVFAVGQAEGFLPRNPRWLEGDDTGTSAGGLDEEQVAALVAQETALLAVAAPTRRLTEQQQNRHRSLEVLRAAGMDPYPVSVPRTTSVADARALAARARGSEAPGGPEAVETIDVVGRVVRLRDLGGVVFAVLREGTDQVQAMLSADGPADLALFRRAVDLGDLVSVSGLPTLSRSGEPSLLVQGWAMAAKSLTPPPDKHKGLVDPETRLRLRHMDLALHDRAQDLLRARSRAVWSIRSTLVDRGFLEVETPILQRIHGGANARPFTTHINAYDMDLYLRIAPELYLKQLMVGGVGRVFELGRNFRNEGVDSTHNPEFTSVEAYAAFGDYLTMRDLTRDLIVAAAVAVHGEPVAHAPDGTVVRLDEPWPSITVHGAVSQAVGTEVSPDLPLVDLRRLCDDHGVAWDAQETHGALVTELYDRLVEGQTVRPTFYMDFPVETSPLTRQHRHDPRLAERWDLVAFGAELGTAYSELVDPVEQRARLTQQSILAAAGDPEAMEVDEGFLSALEFAMPPTGGLGIGVDRVVMTLVGGTIRDTLPFPFARPRTHP